MANRGSGGLVGATRPAHYSRGIRWCVARVGLVELGRSSAADGRLTSGQSALVGGTRPARMSQRIYSRVARIALAGSILWPGASGRSSNVPLGMIIKL